MPAFKDKCDREWLFEINTNSLKRVLKATGQDLANNAAKIIDRLADDPITLVDVLWVLCKPQADKNGVSEEQFADALVGDAIDHATDALVDGLIDFFPRSRRLLLRQLADKAKSAADRATKLAESKLPMLDTFLDKELAAFGAELDSRLTFGSKSTSSPASLESTPTP